MRALAISLAVAGAVSALAALPAGAGSLPAIPQQFQAKVVGTAKFEWENHRGPVGTACADWNTQEGSVRQKFSTRNPAFITLTPGRTAGQGVGPATITGLIDSTVASSLEPGCPAVCPDAKPGTADVRRAGPPARAADCAQTSTPRRETSTACKAVALTPGALFFFRGSSVASLQVALTAEVASGPDKRCVSIGSGLPQIKKLLAAKALRRLGAGATLRRTRTLKGVCPGTKRTGFALTSLGPLKCTYEMHVTVSVSRL